MRRRRPFLLLLCLAAAEEPPRAPRQPLLARSSRGEGGPKLHVATFASTLAPILSPLLASAYVHAGGVTVLGHGVQAHWGKALQAKLDAYRDYVLAMPAALDRDVLLLPDAYDCLLLRPWWALLRVFQDLEESKNRSIIFGAETSCSAKCEEMQARAAKEGAASPWKYLNSGLIAGRVAALKKLFERPANISACSYCASDQEWFIDYFLAHPDEVVLDYDCRLFQNVYGIAGLLDGDWSVALGQPARSLVYDLENASSLLANARTGAEAAVLHFPGPGKYAHRLPCSTDGSRQCESSVLLEAFRAFFPKEYAGSGLLAAQQSSDLRWMPDAVRPVRGYQVLDSLEGLVRKITDRDGTILGLAAGLTATGSFLLLSLLRGLLRRLPCGRRSGRRHLRTEPAE